jgi:hypothetical protein
MFRVVHGLNGFLQEGTLKTVKTLSFIEFEVTGLKPGVNQTSGFSSAP